MVIRVLFADQSVSIQKLAAQAFAQEKIEVIKVGNGDLAMWLLDEINPRLVVADVSLPDTDGYELCNFIKRTPHLSHIPVLLLYWSDEEFDYSKADSVRADAYLMKPFESHALINVARRLLEEEGRSSEPSAFAQDSPRVEDNLAEEVWPLVSYEDYEAADIDHTAQPAVEEPETSFAVEEPPTATESVLEAAPPPEPIAVEAATFTASAPPCVEAASLAAQDERAFAGKSTGPGLTGERTIKSPLAWAVIAIIAFSSILGIWQATRIQKTQPVAAPNAGGHQDEPQSQPAPASNSDAQPAPAPPSESSDGNAPARRYAAEQDRSSSFRAAARIVGRARPFLLTENSLNANRYEARGASDNRGANNNRADDARGRILSQTRPAEFNRGSSTVPKNEGPEQSPVRIIPVPTAGSAATGKAAAPRQAVKPINGFKLIGSEVKGAVVWSGKKAGQGIKAIARKVKKAFKPDHKIE